MKLQFNFFCQDIEAQLRFYTDLLGLPESVHSRSPIYRAVANEHFQLGFHAPRAYDLLGLRARAAATPPPHPVEGYPTFMLTTTGDVDRVAQAVTRLGGQLIQGPYPTYYHQWQAVLADPEQHVFRVAVQGLPEGIAAPVLQAASEG